MTDRKGRKKVQTNSAAQRLRFLPDCEPAHAAAFTSLNGFSSERSGGSFRIRRWQVGQFWR